MNHPQKLSALRAQFPALNVIGFILPRGDEYLGEYVAPADERLAWLTGFTGSAGYAVILNDGAALFTDGRYTLQAQQQLSQDYETRSSVKEKLEDWLKEKNVTGAIGYDPKLHSEAWREHTETALNTINVKPVPLFTNPIDAIWLDRPAPPTAPVTTQPLKYAGKTGRVKCAEIAAALAKDNCDALYINDPTLIAWLFNIRGSDVPHTPITQCQAILRNDASGILIIDAIRYTDTLKAHLGCDITFCSPQNLPTALQEFSGKTMRVTKSNTNSWIVQQLRDARITLEHGADLILNARACKNAAELKGAHDAHHHDGVALSQFIAWLHEHVPSSTLTELDCVAKLQHLRRQHPLYRDDSFPAIVGWAAHGAIIHYRPLPDTNATITGNGLLLVDSGAQYQNGTTDITRTIAIGTPTAEQREIYTRVLKGHIAISRARFPVGTTGGQLDVLARQALWEVGLDFEHGTGHGVGSYLSVHEGPQRMSSKPDTVALQPGMILSNEPGYYRAGEFGIRIENLIYVVEAGNGFLKFETLTLAPYDDKLIADDLLNDAERDWLQAYNIRLQAITS